MANRRAQAHARRSHTCGKCGRVCYGNGYANHKAACRVHFPSKENPELTRCGRRVGGYVKLVEGHHMAKDVCPRCIVRSL